MKTATAEAEIIAPNTAPSQVLALARETGTALTPMDMLDKALSQNADIEVLEKLMGLQERWEKNQARKEFDAAVANAKANIKPVARNSKGHNEKRYADFAAIAKAVDPILAREGLSYRFRTMQADRISVTCILSHKAGHSEETTLTGPADTTGNKNAIQAIGSTLTYLQRYSLVQMLGIAASDDDDARGVTDDGEVLTDEQADELSKLLTETKSNLVLFLKAMKVESLTEIRADKFEAVKKLIVDNAAKREKLNKHYTRETTGAQS